MVDTSERSRSVVRAYLAIAGLYTLSASVIWGVNTLFLLDAGLDIFQVFVANGAFTAGMVLFEIPTGVVADTLGRRASFLMGVVTLLLGTLGYVGIAAIGGGLLPFMAASLVLGLGFSFYSGAVEAWVVDALRASGFEGQLDRVFARGSMVSGGAMLVGTISGGVLGSIDLAWPYLTRAGLLAGAFVLAFRMMHDIGFTPKTTRMADLPAAMKGVLRASVSYGWKVRSVRTLMLVSFVQMGFLTWGFYAWQPYFLELLSRDAVWVGGVVAALIALSTIAGNALVAFFTRFCGRRTTLMLCSALVLSLACVGVGLVSSFAFALMLLLLATGAMGVTGPVKQAYLHAVIPSEHRATVVSFDSLVGSAGGIGGQVGLGYVARSNGIAAGYVTGGLALLVGLPVLGMLRRFGDPADVIVGRKAGSRGACAAQGLPEVASVDTAVRQPAAVS